MFYLKLFFKLEIFCSVTKYILQLGIIYSEIYIKTQFNNFISKKKNDIVRTIRPSCNYVYFVYYYTDVCDLTLIDTFFSKAQVYVSFFLTIESK